MDTCHSLHPPESSVFPWGVVLSVSNVPSRFSKYKYVRNTGNGCNLILSNAFCLEGKIYLSRELVYCDIPL